MFEAFDVIRSTSCTISDLDLGCYLWYRGAKLEGTTIMEKNRAAFTFSHKHLTDLIHEYKQYRSIKFSPRALFDFRDDLKRLALPPRDPIANGKAS